MLCAQVRNLQGKPEGGRKRKNAKHLFAKASNRDKSPIPYMGFGSTSQVQRDLQSNQCLPHPLGVFHQTGGKQGQFLRLYHGYCFQCPRTPEFSSSQTTVVNSWGPSSSLPEIQTCLGQSSRNLTAQDNELFSGREFVLKQDSTI